MRVERELATIEERLWKNDAKLYYDSLTDEALLVFPETGVIGGEAALDAATASPTSA